MQASGPILAIENIHKAFGGVRAVWDVNLSIPPHRTVGLIGPNGSGKTTLLNLIAGLFRPDAGRIIFEGRDLAGCSAHEIARRGIVRTWQDPRIVPGLTVQQNVAIGVLAKSFLRSVPAVQIEELLTRFGLHDVANKPAGLLPYGRQKLLAIARALAGSPKMLLLDEPLAGLSAPERQHIVATVKSFSRSGTVLIVDHAFGVISELCDHVVVLNSGRKLAEGRPEEIAKDKSVIEVYFG